MTENRQYVKRKMTFPQMIGLAVGIMSMLLVIAGGIGSWYVTQYRLDDQEKAIDKVEDVNKIQWQRIGENSHGHK